MTRRQATLMRVALYGAPVLLTLVVRLFLDTYYEFESQEDTLRAMTMLEHGELPLYGIGRIRFLGAALGPLVYYVKALALAFSPHPVAEVVLLVVIRLASVLAAMLLVAGLTRTLIARGVLPGYSPHGWAPDIAAALTGTLLAGTIYVHAITLHAHPAFFAGAFVPILTLAVYRWSTGGSNRWLALASATLGVMTQFYQLALFAPLLMVLAWSGPRRPFDRRSLTALLLPFAICYLPYFISELSTGFANTAGFFHFEPGPQDAASVGFSLAHNLTFFLATITRIFGFAPWVIGPLVLLALTGLWVSCRSLLRVPEVSALLALGFVYTLLPMILLRSVRFELSLPFGQTLIVLGGLTVVPLLQRFWREQRRWFLTGLAALALLSYSVPKTGMGYEIGHVAVIPIRMESASPVGGMPTLAESEEILVALRQRVQLDSADATAHIISPVVLSGFFGQRYLLRVLEGETAATGSDTALHFITDRHFPARVKDGPQETLGAFSLHRLQTTVTDPRVTVHCDAPWCQAASAATIPYLTHRFFWGCGEYRDLDSRLALPRHECEDILTAPRHHRTYRGEVHWAGPPADCPDCRRLVFVIHDPDCSITVAAGAQPAQQHRFKGMKRDYTLALVPDGPPTQTLTVDVPDCQSYSFSAIPFVGQITRLPEDGS